MNARRPTALIAEDEPLLRASLLRQLAVAWPALDIVANARNGREAIAQFEFKRPDICFLDVQMPGVSGVDVARVIGRRAHLVFVTAFSNYAVQAFEHGALDYLVKPVEPERLADTVARLAERVGARQPAADINDLLDQLASRLAKPDAAVPLRWIRASVGSTVRLIAVDDIDFLRADAKYTFVAWRGDGAKPAEALIRTPLKELVPQLDAAQFQQVHRAVIVNLSAISHITRGDNDTALIHLKSRADVLPVSRSYRQLFRQM